jgi:hypothetical protein
MREATKETVVLKCIKIIVLEPTFFWVRGSDMGYRVRLYS